MTMLGYILVLMPLVSTASSLLIGGRHTQIDYNECGLWNNHVTHRGFTMDDCCPTETTYPGSPWQLLVVSYWADGQYYNFYGNAAYLGGNFCNYKVIETKVLDDGSGKVGILHKFDMRHIILTKTETWDFQGRKVVVEFTVEYPNDRCTCRNIDKLKVMHAVDPDQDKNPFYTFSTINDVLYPGGLQHYAEAVGPVSCNTMAYGICSSTSKDYYEEVGFSYWDSSVYAYLFDPGATYGDLTLHYRHTRWSLECDHSYTFRFFVVWGANAEEARLNYQWIYQRECPCSDAIGWISYYDKPCPCKNICPCDCEDARCTCKNKIDNSNFKYPTIYKWLPFFLPHIVGKRAVDDNITDVDTPDKTTPAPTRIVPTRVPVDPEEATTEHIGLAALASAADRFAKDGGIPNFNLDEEIAFVRILDDFPRNCPKLEDNSRAFLSEVNTTNVREVYDEYVKTCSG
jgi:hypothetical protein